MSKKINEGAFDRIMKLLSKASSDDRSVKKLQKAVAKNSKLKKQFGQLDTILANLDRKQKEKDVEYENDPVYGDIYRDAMDVIDKALR